MTTSEKIQKRQRANAAILTILTVAARELPDWRFQQILWNLTISDGSDKFYEESVDTLNKMLENPIVNSLKNSFPHEIIPMLNLEDWE